MQNMYYTWDIRGIYVGYMWDICGIYVGYMWDIDELCTWFIQP